MELTSVADESSDVLPLKPTIPAIHAAFEHVRSRVYSFSDFVRLRPEIIVQLYQEIEKEDGQEMVKKSHEVTGEFISIVMFRL